MTTSYTSHFRVPIPDFLSEPWHETLEETIRSLDTAIYEALLANNAETWANSTVYANGDIVISPTDGSFWVAAVAHTSPALPTTFASFRAANPTYWNASVIIPQQRGTWQTNTSYTANDFVVDSNRYAVCIVSHVSGTFNTDLAAGKWVVLVDVSSLGTGINSIAETSIASATITDIGAVSATRVFVTGTTTITSFGTVANTYRIIRYEGALTLTHNAASLILLGGANRVTAAGDVQFISSNASGQWREIHYEKADGWVATTALKGRVQLATNAEAITGTDAVKVMTPAAHKAGFDSRFFPSGTAMIFVQTAAPTGWTKSVTHNDKALRIVSGAASSGGSSPFSTVFGKTATDSHTTTTAEMPTHSHGVTESSHTHTIGVWASAGGAIGSNDATGDSHTPNGTFNSGSATTNLTINNSTGGGGGHTHPIDIRVSYVDCIIATKD